MRKIILTGLATICFYGMLSAQNQDFGLRAGVNFASFKYEGLLPSETSNETGFYFGVFAEISLSDKVGIRPEINYSDIQELGMFNVPVLVTFNLSEDFTLLAGPNFDYMFDRDESLEPLAVGLQVGMSYDITKSLIVEARYNLGLSNSLNRSIADNSLKISWFQTGLGWRF